MMGNPSNPAVEWVNLFLVHETHAYDKIDRKNEEVDRLVTRMEKLETFLSYIANTTHDSRRLDLQTTEEQQLADDVRQQIEAIREEIDGLRAEGLEHIFQPGKYQWQGEEIENLTRMINQHVEGPLQRQINTLSERTVIDQHMLTEALDIFRSGLNRMNNLIERILGNMARAH